MEWNTTFTSFLLWIRHIQSSVKKKKKKKTMAAIHLDTIRCVPNTAHMTDRKLFFAQIIPVLTTLFMLDFKVLELLCAFL